LAANPVFIPLGVSPVFTPLGAKPVFIPLGAKPVFTPLGGASIYAAWRAQHLSRLQLDRLPLLYMNSAIIHPVFINQYEDL